jgi:hypothetical protein
VEPHRLLDPASRRPEAGHASFYALKSELTLLLRRGRLLDMPA